MAPWLNALAFSGSNSLFSMLKSSGLDEKRKRHDKAAEQLQAAQAVWSRKRTERLNWISEDLRRQGHPDFPGCRRRNARTIAGHRKKLDPLRPEPKFSDFFAPSSGQRHREITFVVLGLAATGIIAYKLAKLLKKFFARCG